MKVSCLLLAAGDSSRMRGIDKLLLEVDGSTLIARTLKEIEKVKFEEVIVVTGPQSDKIKTELKQRANLTRVIENHNFLIGMHGSIKAGIKNLEKPCDAFFICLSDQPYFDHENLLRLMSAFHENRLKKIIAPVFGEKRGHPVLLSADFIPEIMEEPDGDYGCAYLFKRHPEAILNVEVSNDGIVTDIDEPKDYEMFLIKNRVKDPVEEFYKKTIELRKLGKAFAIASVIEVIGSSSARTGSKAIFDAFGKNLFGWVGGGCAERFIGEESKKAIEENKTRIILADLDDEVFGLGVACGGKMRIFIDPVLPNERVALPEVAKFDNVVRSLSGFYGWSVEKDLTTTSPKTIEELILKMSHAVALARGRSNKSLRSIKDVPATFKSGKFNGNKKVTIVGRTRITEALARHFSLLDYEIRAIGPDIRKEDYPSNVDCSCLDEGYSNINFRQGEVVVIASHTSQDPKLVDEALKAKSSHIAMIGSLKRSREVLTHLNLMNKKIEIPLFIPAGLDIDARNPDEIALSIVAEILSFEDGQHES